MIWMTRYLRIAFFILYNLVCLSLLPGCKQRNIKNTSQINSIVSFSQTERSLCSYCKVDMLQEVETNYVNKLRPDLAPETQPETSDRLFIFPQTGSYVSHEISVFEKLLTFLHHRSPTGKRLVQKALEDTQIHYKLFYDMHLQKGFPTLVEPVWVQLDRLPHDLFGFAASDGKRAFIALNNFQFHHMGNLVLAHELYHLFDDYLNQEQQSESKSADSLLAVFQQEYRALLTELAVYQELRASNDENTFYFPAFEIYETFVTWYGSIDYDALYAYLLHHFFPPEAALKNGIFDPDAPINYYAAKKSLGGHGTTIELTNLDIPNHLYDAGISALLTNLLPYLSEPSFSHQDLLMKVSYTRAPPILKEAMQYISRRQSIFHKQLEQYGKVKFMQELKDFDITQLRSQGMNLLKEGFLKSRNLGDKSRNLGDKSRNLGDKSRNLGDKSRNLGDKSRNLGDKSRDFLDQTKGYGD